MDPKTIYGVYNETKGHWVGPLEHSIILKRRPRWWVIENGDLVEKYNGETSTYPLVSPLQVLAIGETGHIGILPAEYHRAEIQLWLIRCFGLASTQAR
jgi:hypothetical protein